MIGTFLLGIFLHRLFGVKTTVDRLLFKRWYKKAKKDAVARKNNHGTIIIWDNMETEHGSTK